MSNAPNLSLVAQATEVELHRLGLKDLLERAAAGKIRRSPDEIERIRKRLAVAAAASQTLADLAAGRLAPAWRPIASAPRTGTAVIGARQDGGELRDCGKYMFDARLGGWIEDEHGTIVELTVWLPLPTLPAATSHEVAA